MEGVAIVLFVILLCAAHRNAIIPTPSSLSPGTNSSVWLSDSGKFALGFYNTPDGYAICIFMAGISQRTVVWTAKELDPVLPNNVVLLSINPDKMQLSRNIRGGVYDLYYEIATPQQTIAGASMLDNGNFVLYNSNGGVIWQSFDYPTDTLLPGQRLRTGQELVSRASGTDLSRGMFRLKMQVDGNLVQYPVSNSDTPEHAYYGSDTSGAGNNLSLNLDSDGCLYLYDGNSTSSYNITSGGKGNHSMYLLRVDPDGIFRVYNGGLDGEGDWRAMWWSTEDKCVPKGICGVNSLCSYQDQTVTCTCLPGYGDGCKGEFDCSATYGMERMANVTWEDNYYQVNGTVTEEDCERACLDDCDCVAALFRKGVLSKNGVCRKQKSPLRYGRITASAANMALVKVSLPAPPHPHRLNLQMLLQDLEKDLQICTRVSIGIAVLVISSMIIVCRTKQRLFCSRDEESKQNVNKLQLNHGSLAPKRYSYKEIKKITNSFTEKLGQGGYGIVYKGKLHDGQLVAVKVLTKTHDSAEEFVNEVASISRTSHVNIVNLLGFCFERKKRALVYEFMPNKSLDKFIYKSASANAECSLEWKTLYEIAVGVARGLEYLHRGCNTRIVHFDIKPQNILLDEEFCAKISDFGLAKLCMKKQSVISMLGTRGTIGYIAPEVFSRNFGLVSHKSDVYSYGIMLLQMAEARSNIVENKSFQSSEDYFLEKIYEHVLVQNEKVYAAMTEEEEEVARKMLMVGFWCIQTAPSDRPSMDKVVDMLEGNVQSIQTPPLPFLLSSPKPEFSCLLPVIVERQSSSDQVL